MRFFTHKVVMLVRTNIEINDALMKKAMKASEASTKKAVVEEALQLLVKVRSQEGIRKWFGKARWSGDLQLDRSGSAWGDLKQGAGRKTKPAERKAA